MSRRLRKKIEASRAFDMLLSGFGGLLAAYVRLCRATGRWEVLGLDGVAGDLEDGPVLTVVWHGRLMGYVVSWDDSFPRTVALSDPSPAGRFGAACMRRFGMEPYLVRKRDSAQSVMRAVLRNVRDGKSLAIAADGPEGPAQEVSQAVVAWVSAARRPVYVASWSVRSGRKLKSWDRFMMPVPFSKATIIYRQLLDAPAAAAARGNPDGLKLQIASSLDSLTAEADRLAGRPDADG